MTNWKWCASLLSLTAASALAQSSVTLYGRIDTSIEYANVGPNHVVRMGSGDSFATLWGLKGSEDLGGGYYAIFKLENGFNSANGALGNNGALFGREAWVGLSGPFGAMQAGINYTILQTSFVTYSLPGDGAGLAWGNAANNFVSPVFLRVNNSVRYTSPRFGGVLLRAIAARGANESTQRSVRTRRHGAGWPGAGSAELWPLSQCSRQRGQCGFVRYPLRPSDIEAHGALHRRGDDPQRGAREFRGQRRGGRRGCRG